jgi:hypothetical protein
MVPGFADGATRAGSAAGMVTSSVPRVPSEAEGRRGPMATIRSTGSVVVALGHRVLADLAAPKPDARLDDVGRFVAVSARRHRVLAVAKPDQRLSARRRPRRRGERLADAVIPDAQAATRRGGGLAQCSARTSRACRGERRLVAARVAMV